ARGARCAPAGAAREFGARAAGGGKLPSPVVGAKGAGLVTGGGVLRTAAGPGAERAAQTAAAVPALLAEGVLTVAALTALGALLGAAAGSEEVLPRTRLGLRAGRLPTLALTLRMPGLRLETAGGETAALGGAALRAVLPVAALGRAVTSGQRRTRGRARAQASAPTGTGARESLTGSSGAAGAAGRTAAEAGPAAARR
ncbi:hypothetical protein QCN29_36730, partial [Streptomyces sp. HNM0663]|nr:hypothetical protein [Streptomyces chengmaiensis]